ncbi:MAG TPA: FtsH protease activity modulator HflK [Terriglobia bacterium]|nr:FtsH protease activity modulator HflK [Terriglobia bacterium]
MDHDRFDEIVKFRIPDVSGFKLPPGSAKMILAGVAALVLLVLLWSSFYQVQPEELGVVLRFGRHTRTTEPGLRWKIPVVEEVFKVPVQRQLKQELGFRTVQAGIRSQFSEPGTYKEESIMLTGDLNVAVVEWIVQYRVNDPYRFLFKVRGLEETFRSLNEAVMRGVVGDRTVTEVLTVGRQEIETTAQQKLQELCDQYETGVTVAQVVLQDVNPPNAVKPSWDEVNQAQQQRDRLINEARAEYNKVIPRSSGEAQQTILGAEGYALDRVNRSQGDASRFKALEAAYRLAPEVTRQRIYLETMQRVLPRVGGKVFLDKNAQGILPLLPLNSLGGAIAAQPAAASPGGPK